MTIDERSRHALFARLEEVLGSEEAATLMEHLPPVGWADVATKRDLDQLSVETKHVIDRLDSKLEATKQELLATFRAELNGQTRTMIFAMSASVVSVAGLAFAAGRLA